MLHSFRHWHGYRYGKSDIYFVCRLAPLSEELTMQTEELEELAASTIRIQENNLDTIVALAQRTFGTAYQFVPPMSVTLGMRECLAARKVRLFSDTGSWKQTALRVALSPREILAVLLVVCADDLHQVQESSEINCTASATKIIVT